MPCPNCGHETSPLGSHDCFAEQSRRRTAELRDLKSAVKDASRVGVMQGDHQLDVFPISSGGWRSLGGFSLMQPADTHVYVDDVESPSTVYQAGDSIQFTTRITGT